MKDLLGIVCSALCLIHCALSPILLLLGLSSLGLAFLEAEWVHVLLAFPMIILAVLSFPRSYRLHQHVLPLFMGMLGIALLLGSFFVDHEYEVYFAISAGIALIAAHLMNRQFLIRHSNHLPNAMS